MPIHESERLMEISDAAVRIRAAMDARMTNAMQKCKQLPAGRSKDIFISKCGHLYYRILLAIQESEKLYEKDTARVLYLEDVYTKLIPEMDGLLKQFLNN